METKKELPTQENNLNSNPEFKTVWTEINNFLYHLLDIRHGTDKKGTIEDIKNNISIKGHTAWVLVFSILMASIGLNISSTAVVIGAMLISPLMGPILGVGLAIGINDIDTLKRSLINLGVMMGLSIGTSFLFFLIPIFRNETPEILARTAPDVRDVFIAIAGGLALIVALSRRSQQTNTVAGVAIATALMPPLCTAGYGLATWNLSYFGGAMFLFAINTVFIALATFVIVKYLRFPMLKYINSIKRKRIAQLASFVALLIFVTSIYLFVNLFKQNQFKQSAQNLIKDIKKSGVSIIDEKDENINYTDKTIKMVVFGKTVLPKELDFWNSKLPSYGLGGTKLIIHQDISNLNFVKNIESINNLFINTQTKLNAKNKEVEKLKNRLNNYFYSEIPFEQISKEAKINYNGLSNLGLVTHFKTNFNKIDTIIEFQTKWYDSISNIDQQKIHLKDWLKVRLKLDTLVVN
jgi:uncharacterized hydrophobic protein (TIGR00271 family)